MVDLKWVFTNLRTLKECSAVHEVIGNVSAILQSIVMLGNVQSACVIISNLYNSIKSTGLFKSMFLVHHFVNALYSAGMLLLQTSGVSPEP